MKRSVLITILTLLVCSISLSAQNEDSRWLTLSNVACGSYPTVLTVKMFTGEADVVAKWQGTVTIDSFSPELQFPLIDPALVDALSTESVRWYRLQCEGEPELPFAIKLNGGAFAAHSADSSSLGGKPASAYALADSVKTTAFTATLNDETARAQMVEGNLALDIASAQSGIQNEKSRAIGTETAISNQIATVQTNVATLTALIADLQAQITALRAGSPAPSAVTTTPASSPITSSTQPQTAQPSTVIRTPIDLTRPSRTAR